MVKSAASLMPENVIVRNVDRCNRNLLLVSLPLLLIPLILVGLTWRYLYNGMAGPLTVSTDQMVFVTHPADLSLYYVELSGSATQDPGQAEVLMLLNREANRLKSEHLDGKWIGIPVRDHLLLIRNPPADFGTFRGEVKRIPESLKASFERYLTSQQAKFGDSFLPVYVDAGWFRLGLIPILGISLPILGLVAVNVFRVFLRSGDTRRSPIYSDLARFGVPPDQTVEALETELRMYPVSSELMNTFLSRSFLIRDHFFGLTILRVDDIVHVDRKVPRNPEDPRQPACGPDFATSMESRLSAVDREMPWIVSCAR